MNIGHRFYITAKSTIICFDSVTFGDDVLISWDTLVIDTDFHPTINTLTNQANYNLTKSIILGPNTWVGTRSILLKGTEVPANTIIGAGSLLNKKYKIEKNCLLAGNPACIKKENIKRHIQQD